MPPECEPEFWVFDFNDVPLSGPYASWEQAEAWAELNHHECYIDEL
jgi:hypothetical protein